MINSHEPFLPTKYASFFVSINYVPDSLGFLLNPIFGLFNVPVEPLHLVCSLELVGVVLCFLVELRPLLIEVPDLTLKFDTDIRLALKRRKTF